MFEKIDLRGDNFQTLVGEFDLNCATLVFLCVSRRAKVDSEAVHHTQVEKLEEQLRLATEVKVCTQFGAVE